MFYERIPYASEQGIFRRLAEKFFVALQRIELGDQGIFLAGSAKRGLRSPALASLAA